MTTNHHTPHSTGDPLDASELNAVYSDLDSAISTNATAIASAGVVLPGTVQGRLTLSSSVAVTTSDVTAATTLYYLPYKGEIVALYDGVADWEYFNIPGAGVSISIPATADTNYDVYLYDASGTLTLELVAWSNDTTRATALATQNGVKVKSGDATRLYLGVMRTTGVSGQCEVSVSKCYVENHYNAEARLLRLAPATNTWTYSVATTWRQANASTANQVDWVTGESNRMVMGRLLTIATAIGNPTGVRIACALDSTSDPGTPETSVVAVTIDPALTLVSLYQGYPAAGKHYLAWLEYLVAANTVTFYGDNNDPNNFQAGMQVTIWA